jgi:hypothetical protein
VGREGLKSPNGLLRTLSTDNIFVSACGAGLRERNCRCPLAMKRAPKNPPLAPPRAGPASTALGNFGEDVLHLR